MVGKGRYGLGSFRECVKPRCGTTLRRNLLNATSDVIGHFKIRCGEKAPAGNILEAFPFPKREGKGDGWRGGRNDIGWPSRV